MARIRFGSRNYLSDFPVGFCVCLHIAHVPGNPFPLRWFTDACFFLSYQVSDRSQFGSQS